MFNTLNLIDTEILLVTEQLNKACHQQASETTFEAWKKILERQGGKEARKDRNVDL